jgi:hypothetical protein
MSNGEYKKVNSLCVGDEVNSIGFDNETIVTTNIIAIVKNRFFFLFICHFFCL